MTASTPLLQVRDLSVSFNLGTMLKPSRLLALRDLSFTLDRGEILALVGESGSGKSTAARLLCRLLPADSGAVTLDGEDIPVTETKAPGRDYRRRVQMIFQDPFGSLNPAHTVAHHLARPLLLHGKADRRTVRERSLELLNQVGLAPAVDFIDKHASNLSGGQRQRVAIARALAPEPDLICADEPTSMLDVSIRMDILKLLNRLRKERGTAVLFITHDLAAARQLADRILVLYAGRLMEEAEADALITDPLHPYTRLLTAAAPKPGGDLHAPLPAGPGRARNVDPPPGCAFADRCFEVTDRCRAADIPVFTTDPGRRVRCLLHETGGAE